MLRGPSSSAAESPLAKRHKLDNAAMVKSADSPPPGKKDKDKGNDNDKGRGKERAPLPRGVARVRSAPDFLADQAQVYSTQLASQDGSGSGDRQLKEPEDVLILDVEMRDINDGENAVDPSGHWARST